MYVKTQRHGTGNREQVIPSSLFPVKKSQLRQALCTIYILGSRMHCRAPGDGTNAKSTIEKPLAFIWKWLIDQDSEIPTLCPMRPGKFRLVVETHWKGSFMRAYVSAGPPRHAAQEGEAGSKHPASRNIDPSVRPPIWPVKTRWGGSVTRDLRAYQLQNFAHWCIQSLIDHASLNLDATWISYMDLARMPLHRERATCRLLVNFRHGHCWRSQPNEQKEKTDCDVSLACAYHKLPPIENKSSRLKRGTLNSI